MYLPQTVALVLLVCVSYIVSSHADWDVLSVVKCGQRSNMSRRSIRVRINTIVAKPMQPARVLSIEDSEMKRADISCGDVFCSCSFFTSRPMAESIAMITTMNYILITSLSSLITNVLILSTKSGSSIH